MLLSFSVPEMVPMLRAGVLQRMGSDISDVRVKRQTIRRRGPRAEKLLSWARQASWTIPYDLHLWWKSRTSERALLGVIEGGCHCYPITILHSTVEPPGEPAYPVLRISGPHLHPNSAVFWSESDRGQVPNGFEREVLADGFESVDAFRDFFVPKLGDVFDGVLFKW